MSHKRKSNGELPPAKKHRQEPRNGRRETATQSTAYRPQPQTNGTHPQLPAIKPAYESQVFTHQSAVTADQTATRLASYDRLEFLGDAYIEVIASRLLWNQFPDLPVGRISFIREGLVKNETLAQFTDLYGFDRKLKYNSSLEASINTSSWTKIKGDVFEAYVAAVILSDPNRGFEIAEDWLTDLWMPKLKDVKADTIDLKTKEELARRIAAPGVKINYVQERKSIKEHSRGIETYFIGVYLTGWGWENQHLGSGKGLNKTIAGNDAAKRALQNTPLIDQVIAKRQEWLKRREEEREQVKEEV